MSLRPYQRKAIDDLYDWMSKNDGNPCLVLPTGAGKSHIVAELCKEAVQNWPETKILMVTHVKELISQNAEKLRQVWPNAPIGIYSAGLGRKDIDSITFAGIQSIRTKAHEIGFLDIMIVDECHMISHKNEGGYRILIIELKKINPKLRVIGLTATPYRLGHGYITDGDALFDALIEPVNIQDLINNNYLAKLSSKVTKEHLDVTGVHKRGGDYIESELAKAVDTYDINRSVVSEVISLAGDRKAWLFFCAGVSHAEHIRDELLYHGITAACITGETPKSERAGIIEAYKRGQIRALTNANVLTTGFDYPDIDLIAMLRPTMSPGLYVQMAGRGMRLKSHTDHCLVLDFAGVVETHGPVTYVNAPTVKNDDKKGEAPVKACENCHELVHASVKVCPECGSEFPAAEPPELTLRNDDIMGLDGTKMAVTDWRWDKYVSKASGKEMIRVTYYGSLIEPSVSEYLTVTHGGYAGQKAMATLFTLAKNAGVSVKQIQELTSLETICAEMTKGGAPDEIEFKRDGKFNRVMARRYSPTRARDR